MDYDTKRHSDVRRTDAHDPTSGTKNGVFRIPEKALFSNGDLRNEVTHRMDGTATSDDLDIATSMSANPTIADVFLSTINGSQRGG